ncbi:MAG: hypothetical protein CMO01_13320 [Thalassobius sp.]|nr:hypothetical protein [Thalassovita sp.]
MKKITLIMLVCILGGYIARAQSENTIPAKVFNSLTAAYGEEVEPWQWNSNGKVYIAFFQHEDEFKFCRIDLEGTIQEKGNETFSEVLPEAVLDAYRAATGEDEPSEVYELQGKKHQGQFLLSKENDIEKVMYLYDSTGKEIRKEKFTPSM